MDIDPEVADIVMELLAAEISEWPEMARSRPKLLSEKAEDILRLALSNVPDGATPATQAKVGDAYGLVKRSRDLGLAAALAELDLRVRRRPPVLGETLRKLDFVPEAGGEPNQRVALCELALGLLEPGDDAILRARLQAKLGAYLPKANSGDPSSNVERAIDILQDAAEVFTENGYPEFWASIQASLAAAFASRRVGSPLKNLTRADEYFVRAMGVFCQATHPARHDALKKNRALAQSMRTAIESGDGE